MIMLVLIFSINIIGVQATQSDLDQELLKKMKGIWLRTEYIENLNRTRSPVKSAEKFREVEVDISKEDESYYWCIVFNFHEGIRIKIDELKILSNNELEVVGKTDKMSYKIKIDNINKPQVIKLLNNGKYIFFKKVDTRSDYLYANKVVLSGIYYDAKGEKYIFNDDMTAEWPNKSFRYKINVDTAFDNDDYFWLVDKKENNIGIHYVFEWKEKKLYLYNCEAAHDFVKKKGKPILELKRK